MGRFAGKDTEFPSHSIFEKVPSKYSAIKPVFAPIFDGERTLFYTFIDGTQFFGTRHATITGNTGDQRHSWRVPIDMSKDVVEGSAIHRLTAASYIK